MKSQVLFLSSDGHVPGIVNALESSVEVAAWNDFRLHVGLIFNDVCDPNWRSNVQKNFRPPLWILPAFSSF